MPRAMAPDEVRAFLAHGTRTAKLATVMGSGAPHVMPVWFVLDGDDLVITTGRDTVKGRDLRRDGRVSVVVEDDRPPFAFVHLRGRAQVTEGAPDLLEWATRIAARYMGEERAGDYGRRNAVPEELLVRIVPERVIAEADIAGPGGHIMN
jgi:PPOX class probable F420-dependent enzyme